jgi:hypothetical protein
VVVQGLVTPDHPEVGKADGRILDYQVAAKKVISNEPAHTEWNPATMPRNTSSEGI